jgi:hypothetical protein
VVQLAAAWRREEAMTTGTELSVAARERQSSSRRRRRWEAPREGAAQGRAAFVGSRREAGAWRWLTTEATQRCGDVTSVAHEVNGGDDRGEGSGRGRRAAAAPRIGDRAAPGVGPDCRERGPTDRWARPRKKQNSK